MSARTIEVYTLEELKDLHPEAYEKVHQEWKDHVLADPDTPWSGEVMDSLKAVIAKCEGKLHDWSIGPYSHCSVEVAGIDDEEQDKAWFKANVLKPLGYVKANGHVYFPGNCALTGYCFDDDCLEQVWKSLGEGETLTEALEGLADLAGRHLEDAVEQQQEEDSMMVNWEGDLFTSEGVRV